MVLPFSHQGLILQCFIAVATQMKDSVKNDPVKLLFEANSQIPGIIPNPVNTYVDFGQYEATSWFRKIKSDYIGVIIMFQVIPIDLEQILVGAKHII